MTDFFRNRTVLVTGGAGFLGQKVVERLARVGTKRIAVPRSAICDLTNWEQTRAYIQANQPDIVIHLAGRVAGIGGTSANPAGSFRDNLMMGAHVIDACHEVGVSKLVLLGTVCSYPKHCPVPGKESDLWNGYPEETNAPYGLAKKAILVQAQAYRQQYGMNAIYLISANLYGPGDNFDPSTSHVIPALIRRFMAAAESGQKEVVCWGDGTPTREFLYVDDCADAILIATEIYSGAEPVNLGSGEEISIRSLAEMIASLTGYTGTISWDQSKPNGQPRRRWDVSRAAQEFGFRASIPLSRGLAETVDWYRKHAASGANG